MRAALRAIAEGDVAPFADIINEAHTGDETNQAWLYHKCHELFDTVMVSYYANHAKEWVKRELRHISASGKVKNMY
jgi:hypothetical protein